MAFSLHSERPRTVSPPKKKFGLLCKPPRLCVHLDLWGPWEPAWASFTEGTQHSRSHLGAAAAASLLLCSSVRASRQRS
jgi:hypothetical protein